MGQEIVYCSRCQSRLLSSAFESGKAFYIDGKPSCVECVLGRLSELSPDEEARVLKTLEERRGPAPTSKAGTPVRSGKRKTSTAHIPHVKAERRAAGPRPGSTAAVLAAVGAAALVVLAVLALSIRPRPSPEPPKIVREEAPPPPPRPPAP